MTTLTYDGITTEYIREISQARLIRSQRARRRRASAVRREQAENQRAAHAGASEHVDLDAHAAQSPQRRELPLRQLQADRRPPACRQGRAALPGYALPA